MSTFDEANVSLIESAKIFYSLPKSVQKRVNALKVLLHKENSLKIERDRKIFEIETEYLRQQNALYEKRREIIENRYEPTEEESVWKNDFDGLEVNGQSASEENSGIPDFWLEVLKNSDLCDMISPEDEDALKSLVDIRIENGEVKEDVFNWTVTFEFGENAYFSNKTLTLSLEDRFTQGEDDEGLLYDGPSTFKITGCPIDWKGDMCLTERKVQVVKRRKNKPSVTVVKTKPTYSFFVIFCPSLLAQNPEKPHSTIYQQMTFDDAVEFCHTLKESLVSLAVMYYLKQIDCDETFEEEDAEDETNSDCSCEGVDEDSI